MRDVSWDECQLFVEALRKNVVVSTRELYNFALPTEAQWEYACRSGGKRETYCGGNDVNRGAWDRGNSGKKTHAVGQKASNGLPRGLIGPVELPKC